MNHITSVGIVVPPMRRARPGCRRGKALQGQAPFHSRNPQTTPRRWLREDPVTLVAVARAHCRRKTSRRQCPERMRAWPAGVLRGYAVDDPFDRIIGEIERARYRAGADSPLECSPARLGPEWNPGYPVRPPALSGPAPVAEPCEAVDRPTVGIVSSEHSAENRS